MAGLINSSIMMSETDIEELIEAIRKHNAELKAKLTTPEAQRQWWIDSGLGDIYDDPELFKIAQEHIKRRTEP
jgi:hypothetical protein